MSTSVEKSNKLISNDHAKQTLIEMWDYAKEELFCDVTFIAELDGKKISAHRPVLSAANEFFRSMFNGSFKESKEKEVTILDISGDILELLIEYCYTGAIDINEENVHLILPQASLMLFTKIVEACSHFLMSSINLKNCWSLIKYAQFYNIQPLLESAMEHVQVNFLKIILTEEFLNLSQFELEECLSFDELNVNSETEVLQAMMKWVCYDSKTRIDALPKLLPFIRLHHIDNNYLYEYVVNNYHKEHYFPLLMEGINKHRNVALTVPARIKLKTNRMIIICSEKIHIFNPVYKVVEFSHNIPDIGTFVPALFGDKVMFVGGRKIYSFDLNTSICRMFGILDGERDDCSIEMLNGQLHVIGGCYETSVGRWDPKMRRIKYLASMTYSRCEHCTIVFKGKIYAIGGYRDDWKTLLNTVECFNPETDEWRMCGRMSVARAGARAVVMDDEIYVFGGWNSQYLNLIEKYNPESNTWTEVSEMVCRRGRMAAYLFDKKIYVLGGFDGKKWLTSIEEFDPLTKKCRLISDTNIEHLRELYCFPYISEQNKE